LLGARLLRQGVHPAEVARQVGVHRQSVSRWAAQLKQGGVRALKHAERAGRHARLGPEDLRRIERGLKRGPEALGYETSLWTSGRVAHLIEQECGVQYHASQAWRILRQLGWSCQRPVGRAQSSATGWNASPERHGGHSMPIQQQLHRLLQLPDRHHHGSGRHPPQESHQRSR
jgi:putative transposase